jgi:hypothetical protein
VIERPGRLSYSSIWPCLSALLLAALFASSIYRAATQSLTIDEAFSFQLYLKGNFIDIFTSRYDANNHVLYTVLAWLSVHAFGVSEMAMRLPSLAGALVFFAGVFRISSLVFGRSPLHLLSVAIAAGNPYVLDFFTVARGYGLALGFLAMTLAVLVAAGMSASTSRWRLACIGICAAICVTANLAFLFPVAGVFCALSLLEILRYRNAKDMAIAFGRVVCCAVLPFFAITCILLAAPLQSAQMDDFYFGAPDWRATIASTIHPSLDHDPGHPAFTGSPLAPLNLWVFNNSGVLIPAVFCLTTLSGLAAFFAGRNRPAALPSLVLTFTVALLAFAHAALSVKLPVMRTTTSLLFLLSLALACMPRYMPRVAWAISPVFLFLVITYVRQRPADYVGDWREERSTRVFAEEIEKRRAASGVSKITVGGSWIFEPALNFYRNKNGYRNWEVVTRREADSDSDYYILAPEHKAVIASRHLTVLAEDPVAQSVLAQPPAR